MKYKTAKSGKVIKAEDYSKTVLLDLEDFGNDGHLLQTVTIPPNTKQRVHSHKVQTEVFYILEGECSIFINDKEFVAIPGDSFICEPGDRHYLWNRSDEEFKLVVFKINKPEEDDTAWEE